MPEGSVVIVKGVSRYLVHVEPRIPRLFADGERLAAVPAGHTDRPRVVRFRRPRAVVRVSGEPSGRTDDRTVDVTLVTRPRRVDDAA